MQERMRAVSYTQPRPALPMLAGNWWALLLRGVAAVLFGLVALSWPELTLFVLIVLFGVYALADGVLAVLGGIRGSEGRRWLLMAEGMLSSLAGLAVLFWPGMTAQVLLYVISAWAILTGLLKVGMAIAFRRQIENEWLMASSGVLSLVFGIVLGVFPIVGLLSLVWLVGIYALILGAALVVLGFRARGYRPANESRVR
jgi:uncharacterized membrane protein HdeD (DUF308 family)